MIVSFVKIKYLETKRVFLVTHSLFYHVCPGVGAFDHLARTKRWGILTSFWVSGRIISAIVNSNLRMPVQGEGRGLGG